MERSLTITGTLHGREETTVSAKVGGRITAVLCDLGDAAPSGTPVIQIDPTDYQLTVDTRRAALAAALARLGLSELPSDDFDIAKVPTVGRARAEEANALARFERARELFEQTPPLIAEQEYADIRTQSEVASWSASVEALTAGATLAEARAQAAQLAAAQQQHADTTLRAPTPPEGDAVPYRVGARLVALGELVSPGQPLMRLVASDVLKFRGQVPERFIERVRPGQGARVSLEAGIAPVEGVVTRVAPSIDQQTRTFAVEIEVSNFGGSLKPGGFALAEIITGIDPDVPHVSAAAVATFAGVQRVFVVRDGLASREIVSLGETRDGLTELLGQVRFDQVIAEGSTTLADRQPVIVGATDRPGSPVPVP